ncbi:MAG: peroxiredoxin [Phenylobacterium sp.]|uniref:peroxiredoxin n=1 Tax=Phenylobacterium sp. TaxID=1871053 RepID=UPI001A629B65|nr:peroxiredoxin [Phenylobacterium sp.]MBL8553326.1 peroxiredoxin [Phenylobacterium sp.]
MKRIVLAAAVAAVLASPAAAALKPGDKAPNFTAPGYLAGDPVQLSLAEALKKGPVVLYFFPSAYTKGCNLEAHLFSEAADQFKAQKATVIGVTAGAVDRLAQFSKDTEHCGGKFAVAADPGARIAKSYDSVLTVKPDWSDRTSYVIAPNGTILHAYSKLDPSEHVTETLGAVKAYNVRKK